MSPSIKPSTVIRDLGVWLHSELTVHDHISKTASSCFFHLRRLRQLRGVVCRFTKQRLLSAFVLSRLDYCNAVLSGLPSTTLDPLLRVLNAAVRLVAGSGPRDHVRPNRWRSFIGYQSDTVLIWSYVWWCTPLWLVNTFVTLSMIQWQSILCQHYLDETRFEQLRVASSTFPGQELFLVKELSPWLVYTSGTLFNKTLQTSQTKKLLNELLGHIILN